MSFHLAFQSQLLDKNQVAASSRSLVSISRDVGSSRGVGSPISMSAKRMSSPSVSSQRDSTTINDDLVCDYDVDRSPLYTLLESSNWELAVTRCRTHPQECRTWVVRRDRKTMEVRWKLLPIHAAVIFQSPTFVVETLLGTYPEGVLCVDDQGMLPLHLAFRHKTRDEVLLQLLLVHHPNGVDVLDRRGRRPLELGREGFYSAQMVELYSSAFVAAVSEKYQAQIKFEDAETRHMVKKADHQAQIGQLKSHYEARVAALEHSQMVNLTKLQETARLEKEGMERRYQEEIHALHDASKSAQENCNVQEFTLQVQDLKLDLNHHKMRATQCAAVSDDLKKQLQTIAQQQTKLQSVVVRQQEEVEASQAMRTQLLKALLQQEEDHTPILSNYGNEIHDLLKKINLQIKSAMNKVETANLGKNLSGKTKLEYMEANQVDDEDISAITDGSNY